MAQNKNIRRKKVFLVGDTPKEKWQFFWKYYKWNALICLIGLIIFGKVVIDFFTSPVLQMQGFMLNTYNEETDTSAEELSSDFVKAYNIDTSDGMVLLCDDWTYEPDNKDLAEESADGGREILIQKQKGNLDFITGYKEIMLDLAYNSLFVDLSTILSKEEMELYKPYILYMDQTVNDKLAEAYEDDKDLSSIAIPDATKPEEMDKPIPVLIDISHCNKLANIYDNPGDSLAFGFVADAPNYEMPMDFLTFIMKED